MRLLGVDPGYDRLGVAIVERENNKDSLLFSDCLTSEKKSDFSKRLLVVGEKLEKIIKKYQPNSLALESLFFSKNRKTALAVAETRGVIRYLASQNNLEVAEYSPATIKLTITGYGQADKQQVALMVEKLLSLKKAIKHDDEYDAIAVALTALSTSRLK